MESTNITLSNPIFSDDDVKLIKDTICKGSSDEELKYFLKLCSFLKLNPFQRQINMIPRWDGSLKKYVYTPQVSRDGMRVVADRTGMYSPGKKSEFEYENGKLISATSYVMKLTSDGTWHEVSDTCYYEEYVQTTKEGTPNALWSKMPRVMLSKCAESAALRKAFPHDLSGIYTQEEIDAGIIENISPIPMEEHLKNNYIDANQAFHLSNLLEGCDDYKNKLFSLYGVHNIAQLPAKDYDKILRSATKHVNSVDIHEVAE